MIDIARALGAPVLLDSGLRGHSFSSVSYVGVRPFAEISAVWDSSGQAKVTLTSVAGSECTFTDRPMDLLRDLLNRYRLAPSDYALHPSPLSLHAGAIGCIGYDARHLFAKLPSKEKASASEGVIFQFMLFDDLIVRDEERGQTWLSIVTRGEMDHHRQQTARRDDLQRQIDSIGTHAPNRIVDAPVSELRNERARYEERVRHIQDRIAAGDAFEVCLTRQIRRPFDGDPYALCAALRETSPAPFASLLRFNDFYTVFASPERFVSLDRKRVAETCPIKGTRRRGTSPAEDDSLRNHLANDPKDKAEHTMAVDVARNDLGRVCETASVHVSAFQRIEAHPTVFQMVSDVRGTLLPEKDALDLIGATFPGASMTGAPKVQAMKLIDELEDVPRGLYSGAIGYIDFSGTMDLSMAIRGIVVRDGTATMGTGGAIVSDSVPADEFDETELKARAMLSALGIAARS